MNFVDTLFQSFSHSFNSFKRFIIHAHTHAITFYILVFILLMFIIMLILNTKNKKHKIKLSPSHPTPKTVITSHDIRAIAGDDMLTTQLDLGRAYIEMGKKQLAKQILNHVKTNGTEIQKQEAERLLKLC